ncbi:MAG: hypothetical protein QW328_07795 [Nitrososphaerota archaeon]
MTMTPLDRLKNDLLHVLRASHFRLYGDKFDLDVFHAHIFKDTYTFRLSSQDLVNIQGALRNFLEPLTSYGLEYEYDLKHPRDVSIFSVFDDTPPTESDYRLYNLYIGNAKEARLLDTSNWKTVLILSPYFAFSRPGSTYLYRQSHLKYSFGGEFLNLRLNHKDEIYWTDQILSRYRSHLESLYIKSFSFWIQEYVGGLLEELDRVPDLIKYYHPNGREGFSLFFFHPGEVKLSERDSLILLTGMVMRFPLSV